MKVLTKPLKHARVTVTALALAGALAGSTVAYASSQTDAPVAHAQPAAKVPVGLSAEARAEYNGSSVARVAVQFYIDIQSGRFAPFTKLLAKNWVDTPLSAGQGPGAAGWQSQIEYLHQAIPDLRISIDAILVQGDTVSVRETFSGHQDGSFLGVAPTGRLITFRAADTHTISHGRITDTWHLEDQFGAYQQMTAG